eukprot:gene1909-biopygen8289
MYAMQLGPLVWIPVTVLSADKSDGCTVLLHYDEWRRRNPRLITLDCATRPPMKRARYRRTAATPLDADSHVWGAMMQVGDVVRNGIALNDLRPLWADPVDPDKAD